MTVNNENESPDMVSGLLTGIPRVRLCIRNFHSNNLVLCYGFLRSFHIGNLLAVSVPSSSKYARMARSPEYMLGFKCILPPARELLDHM